MLKAEVKEVEVKTKIKKTTVRAAYDHVQVKKKTTMAVKKADKM